MFKWFCCSVKFTYTFCSFLSEIKLRFFFPAFASSFIVEFLFYPIHFPYYLLLSEKIKKLKKITIRKYRTENTKWLIYFYGSFMHDRKKSRIAIKLTIGWHFECFIVVHFYFPFSLESHLILLPPAFSRIRIEQEELAILLSWISTCLKIKEYHEIVSVSSVLYLMSVAWCNTPKKFI